jgi:hypothetical protein
MPVPEMRLTAKDFAGKDKVYVPELEANAYKFNGRWSYYHGDVPLPLTIILSDAGIIEGKFFPGESGSRMAFDYLWGK